ncbi:hypothetical protein RQP53_01295 [Paucibacter sp. APW11]|uniref:Uncharacterized protein n=1 Tax=Roseateles aquae TaxID=3077235 RepID=A0ABU3P6Q5_9BURK|nr:hypothetical protein [Paucibacter sp. APW11]MDT8997905.1 hypothetical protein [Paucibacter sp. APW11]
MSCGAFAGPKPWLLTLCLLLMAGQAFAEADLTNETELETDSLLQLRFGPALHADAGQEQLASAQAGLSLKRAAGHETWRLRLQAEARHSDAGDQASVGEAYLAHQQGRWSWRLGRQRFEWAITDTVSPSDLLNARDWRDLSRPQKLARTAFSLRQDSGDSSLEWVLAPRAAPSELPAGVWAQPLPPGLSQAPVDAGNSRWTTALRWSARLDEQEFSLVAFHGQSYAPMASLAAAADGRGWLLQPRQDGMDALSLGLTRPLWSGSLLRAEAALLNHQRSQRFAQWVISIDHERFAPFAADDSLYLLLQLQGERLIGERRDAPAGWWDFRRVFANSLMTRLQYKPGEQSRWQWALEANWRPRQGGTASEHFARMSLTRQLGEGLQLELSATSIGGPPASFWGSYARQDRLSLALQWRR